MSRYIPVTCACSHAHRKGPCSHRACGCLYYRPCARVLPPVAPRVVRGAVVLQVKAVTS